MRTSPLPNRHAYELDLYTECTQTTLNKPKNRKKPPLNELGILSLLWKLLEEVVELVLAIASQGLRRLLRCRTDYARVEQEAQDVNVVLLGIWMRARDSRRLEKGEG